MLVDVEGTSGEIGTTGVHLKCCRKQNVLNEVICAKVYPGEERYSGKMRGRPAERGTVPANGHEENAVCTHGLSISAQMSRPTCIQ
jgi:hypothetical protein